MEAKVQKWKQNYTNGSKTTQMEAKLHKWKQNYTYGIKLRKQKCYYTNGRNYTN